MKMEYQQSSKQRNLKKRLLPQVTQEPTLEDTFSGHTSRPSNKTVLVYSGKGNL